jgi:hypothetical protein
MRARRRSVLAVAVVVSLAGALGACTAVTPPRPGRQVVGCDRASERVTLTTSAVLDPSCTYTGGFDIIASNVVLDCRGAHLQGAPDESRHGVAVSAPVDSDLVDVTIRRCTIDGFFHAVDIARDGVTGLAAGHEYDHHLRHVVVEDSHLVHSRGVGLYVHPYVTGTVVRRDVIDGSASTGVYLDEGSRDAKITQNVVTGNGFVENGPGGTNTNFGGLDVRFWGPGREGIAVDGASDNVIAHNVIAGNSAGGVFLYTNCGENVHTDPANWLDHRYGAEHNVVAANVIAGAGTGVWIGSRMGENVVVMDCSDVPYVSGPLQAITLDRAPYNTARDNVIVGADFGVRVEDDDATITRNRFVGSGASQYAVVVGTPYRTRVLDHPVTDTVVTGNDATITGNASPYRWVAGVDGLRDARNTALGHAATFCLAPDVPRGPFVMVYAVALQDPSQPPVAPPPYTVPSLGELPACDATSSP